jgi:hypothetical protein
MGGYWLYMAQTDRRGIVFQNCADASDRVAVRSMAADVVHGDSFVDWCLMVSKGRLSSGQATGVLACGCMNCRTGPRRRLILGPVLPSCWLRANEVDVRKLLRLSQ